MSITDEQIAARCKNGDMQAFDDLVTKYQSKVINMAYGMLSDKEDAYDAAQEVFLKIYKYIGNFRGQASLSTWIYRITVNVCNDFLRKRGRKIVVSLSQENDDDKMKEIPDESSAPHEHAERNETCIEVREAISQLKEEYRQVILLYDIEGLSYEEISDVVRCPVGTVKSRLNRARKALRQILSDKRELFLP